MGRFRIAPNDGLAGETLSTSRPLKGSGICMSDGTHYDITNHDMAWVTKSSVGVGLDIDAEGFAEYAAR